MHLFLLWPPCVWDGPEDDASQKNQIRRSKGLECEEETERIETGKKGLESRERIEGRQRVLVCRGGPEKEKRMTRVKEKPKRRGGGGAERTHTPKELPVCKRRVWRRIVVERMVGQESWFRVNIPRWSLSLALLMADLAHF